MAIWRVWNGAAGADDGTSWTDAFTTLKRAMEIATNASLAVGDIILYHKSHTESYGASGTIGDALSGGTAFDWLIVLCVDKDNSDALSIATVQTITQTSGNLTWGPRYSYVYGMDIDIQAADMNVLTPNVSGYCVFEDTILRIDGASGSATFTLGGAGSGTYEINCDWLNVTYYAGGATSDSAIKLTNGRFCWRRGALKGTGVDLLFSRVRGQGALVEDVEMSEPTSLGIVPNLSISNNVHLRRCKMPASFNLADAQTAGGSGQGVILEGCHTGTVADPDYGYNYISMFGSVEMDAAEYRTGGYKDDVRTNPLSWKAIAKGGNTKKIYQPFCLNPDTPIPVWTDGDGSTAKTFTIEFVSDTTYQNDQLWVVFEYPSETTTASLPDVQSTRLAPLGTPANVPSSAAAWQTAIVEQKIAITVTPDKPGVVRAWVYFAPENVADKTIWVCPMITVT